MVAQTRSAVKKAGRAATGAAEAPMTSQAIFWSSLLAVQFGLQSFLMQIFVDKSTDKLSLVLAQEGVKIALCVLMLILTSGPGELSSLVSSWTLRESLRVAAIPSMIYAAQNVMTQMSMLYLDPVTFNLVNQSKLLATALFVYLILGRKQSVVQCLAVRIGCWRMEVYALPSPLSSNLDLALPPSLPPSLHPSIHPSLPACSSSCSAVRPTSSGRTRARRSRARTSTPTALSLASSPASPRQAALVWPRRSVSVRCKRTRARVGRRR